MTPDDRRPIGLLGGSFDPIHIGHVQFAHDALHVLGLARVLFIPAGLAWQKGPSADAAHRARMIELAIADEPGFALDARELQRPGPTFTVDTLRQVRQEVGPNRPLVLLIGSDQFERLDTWHCWEQLIELAHIGVAERPGQMGALKPQLAQWRRAHLGNAGDVARRPAGAVVAVAMRPVACSSTQIRALLRVPSSQAGAAVNTLLAPGVLAYIRQHSLYS
ncbi:MAG TPA: nicotinate-nucleotide adenylyltransferase [Burkholderiaceae bacterium]|jgi:nicotinate-nucleotide adenylyltransferase|nr:nicotinate-nucleotide adenylyltransferase [Burkholderiaceae bacterium]